MNSRWTIITLLVACTIVRSTADATGGKRTILKISSAVDLQKVFSRPVDLIEIRLQAGEYHLAPQAITDSTCGNCELAATPVQATAGLHVRGRSVRLIGPADGEAVIVTHAGYGLYFERCDDGLVEHLTITGGERDTNGNATDAAIVVKNSRVIIRNNLITNNIGDGLRVRKTVVGIMGICGREGGHLTITGNRIIRNSWDGIALYRDAQAVIEDNVIDGVDKARGEHIGGGRGVGIGITWNGAATVRRNLVTRYWKGIGVFVDAKATVQENIVEDLLTWGIAYWDADKGMPVAIIERNVVYKTGACSVSITRSRDGESPGSFVDNIIVETAQNPKYDSPDYYCYQCALALHAVPKGFVIESNLFYNNRRATPDLPDNDVSGEQFRQLMKERCSELNGHASLASSLFLSTFCRDR